MECARLVFFIFSSLVVDFNAKGIEFIKGKRIKGEQYHKRD
jgi:hypothetical protein